MEIFKALVPLLVVILAAALSGYVVPRLTRRWQDHEKELDIKIAIIEDVCQAVVRIILAMQLSERGAIAQKEFDQAYQNWEIERATLSAKIRTYFVDPEVADNFDRYFEALGDFYALGGINQGEYREKQILKLKDYFGGSATDWSKLEDLQLHQNDRFNWFFAWWDLRQAALLRKDLLTRGLLTQSTRLTAP